MTNTVSRWVLPLISRRHRAWSKLLASLTLDIRGIQRPLPAPTDRDFIICGCPRSGTTLMAAALFQPPHVLTVSEPWDGLRMPPADLFASLRQELHDTGTLSRGRLDIAALRDTGAVRWIREGKEPVNVSLSPGYSLGIKWPAFWRYIDLLPTSRFILCVRDRDEVVESMRRHGGPLADGYEYDVPFNREMNRALASATTDPARRRELLYDYVNSRALAYAGRPNVFVVQYQRWFSGPDRLLRDVGSFLEVDLGPSSVRILPRRSRHIDSASMSHMSGAPTSRSPRIHSDTRGTSEHNG